MGNIKNMLGFGDLDLIFKVTRGLKMSNSAKKGLTAPFHLRQCSEKGHGHKTLRYFDLVDNGNRQVSTVCWSQGKRPALLHGIDCNIKVLGGLHLKFSQTFLHAIIVYEV